MKSFYFFLYGFSSIFIQTYLLRETIFVSGGNELTIAFFFFFWFFGIFFGSIFGKNFKGSEKSFILFLSFFPFFSFLNYIIVFLLNFIFSIPVGGEPSFLRGILSSFGFSFFNGFYIGFLFPLSILFQRNLPKVFFFESAGSFFSGCILTLFLLKFLSPFKALLFLSIILLSFSSKKIKFLLLIPLLILNFEGIFNKIRYKTIGIIGKVQREIQSPYQNIIISSLKETSSIYLNGKFSSQYPSGEAIDLRYYPFFSIPEKIENILIYGFPMGNEENLSKLRIKNIEIIESDPYLIKLIEKNKDYYKEKDLRDYLDNKNKSFDLIIIDMPPPSSLLSSRFCTIQFFKILKKSLRENGFFVLYLNFPQDFWGNEMEKYSSSIYNSLKSVFVNVKIGISQNPFFLSSNSNFSLEKSLKRGEKLFENIKDFSPSILSYFFPDEKTRYFEEKIRNEKKSLIKDEKPFNYLNILRLKSKMEEDNFIYKLFSIPKIYLSLLILIPLIYLKKNLRVYFSVFSNGSIGIGLYLILSFLYQVKYGILYSRVGLLTSLFMLGLAFSSLLAKFLFNKNMKIWLIDFLFIIYLSSLFLVNTFPQLLFFAFFFLAGLFSGIPFTFIGLLKGGGQVASAQMEAQDHLGASIGALISGTIFIPLFGIYITILLFILIKFYSIFLILKN